jgi:hypothetical protein
MVVSGRGAPDLMARMLSLPARRAATVVAIQRALTRPRSMARSSGASALGFGCKLRPLHR